MVTEQTAAGRAKGHVIVAAGCTSSQAQTYLTFLPSEDQTEQKISSNASPPKTTTTA